jgi:protein involved in ribonucleotide reduction
VFAGVGYLIYGVLGAGLAALLGTFVAGRIVSAVWTVPMVESFENSLQDVADLKNHKAVCAATAESFGRVEELSGHRDQLLDHT